MRKLLLATTALIAMTGASRADSITATVTDNGVNVNTTSSGGSLDIPSVTFGNFQVNSVTADSHSILGGNSILDTNTIDIKNMAAETHTQVLVIDIKDTNITGITGLQNFLSEFSVTNLTAGWTAQLQSYINGALIGDTGALGAETIGLDQNFFGTATSPMTAEVKYTITDPGGAVGEFNGGIDVSVTAAVPEPSTWAMMLLGFCGITFMAAKRRRDTGRAFRLV